MSDRVRIIEKHPVWIRWTHWINFPVLFLMIVSGLQIYWSYRAYPPFFPAWFFRAFHLDHRLADGMAVHFSVMWIFTINGATYVLYLAVSGAWRELFPQRGHWREAIQVALHDFGLRKTLPAQGKFNAAQRIAYSSILLMGVGSLLSGLAIYKPTQVYWLTWCLGGYASARLIHFVLTIGFCLFFLVHIAQVIRAGWNAFRAMITGFEVVEK